MKRTDALQCSRCGAEVGVIFYQGFETGRRVLKPFVLKSEGCLFVFVQCPLHGQLAKQIAARDCPGEITAQNVRDRTRQHPRRCLRKRASRH